ncbi:MAG: phage tail tape measure protein [Bacteroidales bacterium]|nr:phage tail tape measure protein [Candidatus Scybalousia scybalohippi]
MALKKIGASIVLEGEKEYRNALKNLNNEQKLLTSEMKRTQAQYKDQQNGSEALKAKYENLNKQIDKQNEKISVYEKGLEAAREAEKKSAENVKQYTKDLDIARVELEKMKNSSEATADAIKEQEEKVSKLENALEKSNSQYEKNSNSVKSWQIGLTNAKTALVNMENDLENTGKYLDEAEKSTDGLAKSIDKYGNEVKKAEDKTSTFGEVLKANLASDVIIQAVEKLTTAIIGMAKASIDSGSSFEANMSQVAATMGMTADEIQNGSQAFTMLEDAAKKAGATTMFSASQASEALNYLALAGYDAEKSAETLPKVLNLAAAGGLDLAYASDLVTDSMAALGLETDELDMFMDELAKTSQKSNTSVAQLGEALLVVGGTSSTTGQDLAVINTELGILANNGIKGAEGGTHLRNILLALASPTEKAEKNLTRLGISVENSDGSMRALSDIMVDLNAELSTMGEVEKAQVISNIFNKTDISAVNALLKGSVGEFDALYNELMQCDGAAKDMADTMQDNLKGKITILQSAMEGLQITAYDLFDDALKDGVDSATDAVGRLDEALKSGDLGVKVDKLAEAFGDFVDSALDFAEDALPVVIDGLTAILGNADKIIPAIEGIVTGFVTFKGVTAAIETVNGAMDLYRKATQSAAIAQEALNAVSSANPYVLLASVLAGVGVALYGLSKNASNAKDEMQELVESYKKEIEQEKSGIEDRKNAREELAKSVSTTKALKDELIELNSKEKLSNEEKQRMKQVVSELNSVMPDLNLALDEETGHLTATNEQIEAQINNRQELLLLQAAEADMAEIANDLYEAEKNRADIEEQLAEAKENQVFWENELIKAQEEGLSGTKWIGDYAYDLQDIEAEAQNAVEKVNTLNGTLNDQNTVINNLQGEYDAVNAKIDTSTGKVNDLTGAYSDNTAQVVFWRDQIITVNGNVSQSLDELKGAYEEAKIKAQDSLEKQLKLFGELSNESDLTVQQMADNLKQQTDVMNTYADDMNKAKDLVEKGLMDEGLLGELQEMGLSGAGYLHELVKAAEEDQPEFQAVMDAWTDQQEALDNLSGTLADMETAYSDSFDEIMTNVERMRLDTEEEQVQMNEGWEQFFKDVKATFSGEGPGLEKLAKDAGELALKGIKDVLRIDSGASAEGQDIGEIYGKSIAQGILNSENDIFDAIDSVSNSANERIKKAAEDLNRALGGML